MNLLTSHWRFPGFIPAIACLLFLSHGQFAHGTGSGEGHAGNEDGVRSSGLYESSGGADFIAPTPGTYKLPPIKRAGDGDVLSHAGRALRLNKLMRGRITILSFIYTSCDDIKGCPLATAKLFDLHDMSAQDQELAENAALISLSFDPKHDTPEVMKGYGYAAISDQDAGRKMPWHFLTTPSQQAINSILAQYGQVIDKRGTGTAISHLLRVYLIDRTGQIRNIYGLGSLDPRLLVADIKTLLIEEETRSRKALQ